MQDHLTIGKIARGAGTGVETVRYQAGAAQTQRGVFGQGAGQRLPDTGRTRNAGNRSMR